MSQTPLQTLRALEAAATQGRWTVPHFARPKVGCECGYIFADGQDGMGSICDIHFGDEDEPKETAAANGKLIAAMRNLAPELLDLWKAAEEARLEGERVRLPNLESPCVCPTCKAVLALNAKAQEVMA
ncbi:hypothetical protein [Mesoterricola silvestris]|uniref:Uncharacterized protein n=1 Tax=Mesoterricola silvestris TaxID=2927979 RepID=A0AA48K9I1_9BACT|nr:hypothetical protein [Mesoterricola silvestris]BDU72352.1 hypothetical protein METEAL_15260 [Mesoterricola silvestris]